MSADNRPTNLAELTQSGWQSKSVKDEIRGNFLRSLAAGEELFPGILGYENTVTPEISIALLSGHDMLFLGEKGQAKSRIMRLLARFLDEFIPFVDIPEAPIHDDPLKPISKSVRDFVATHPPEEVPIGWWHRDDRYAERLSPGTKFADIIGEIDPAKLAGGTSMSAEDALHFGLIPRMHRGIFAMNELPELDELVQVGLFNILEERDVQIRGYPIKFDIDVLILFSANPSTYNRSGKVIPQLKDRIGSVIHTHYPRERDAGIRIMEAHENYNQQHQDIRVEDGIQYGDRLEHVNFDYAAKLTAVNAIALASIAWAPTPPDGLMIGGAVQPSTRLRWDEADDNHIAGYKIYWRDTTSPQWQYSRYVGKLSDFTLENIVIDNFLFGVVSVSADGHESIVSFPTTLIPRR